MKILSSFSVPFLPQKEKAPESGEQFVRRREGHFSEASATEARLELAFKRNLQAHAPPTEGRMRSTVFTHPSRSPEEIVYSVGAFKRISRLTKRKASGSLL